MSVLARETDGTSYKAYKYSLDDAERPYIDYGEDEIIWQKRAETEQVRKYINLSDLSKKLLSQGESIFKYFLDGSRRVCKADDMSYGGDNGIYPVVAGQIGVACSERVNKKLKIKNFKYEIVLSLPDIANADGKSGFFESKVIKLNESKILKRVNLEISNILPYRTNKAKNFKDDKFEDRGTARVQERMLALEQDMVAELVRKNKLNQDNYLIKDGSLEYKPSSQDLKDKNKYKIFMNNYNWVIGVSKNFNPEVCLDANGKSNPEYIANLPLYHRTPAACFKNPKFFGDMQFAVWYVRIRDRLKTRTAFDGVLKLEKMLVTREENEFGIESNLINLLSANIINERSPVCYGSDLRWANHLYPVYLTERYIKSKYLSSESFLNLF